MTKEIWKYEVPERGMWEIHLPVGAEVLGAYGQRNTTCFWALVDPKVNITELRRFEVFGTGGPVECSDKINRKYLGSALIMNGALIYHVFELLSWDVDSTEEVKRIA